ncbi:MULTISPECIES: hypothetical protein [Lelliottia]|uniref:Uncharacterized protein n=1 Tax=Lelliottia aquatilis TaxID=2080838 RepID=A0ABX5A337_9ENTR|nr:MULTISPECIES: hypothetical protein [Lelliottia]NTZ46196.1 hypothetical protein [Lelliottia aquatilis]POZ17539.1 hypothetical protein C3Z09_07345 [Lelliottia aquatilis]POZ22809.1 hypothetical protein C3712_11650 [Lelliottia aquatilis]POZ25445.1 hypothetical protein C3708_12805 [Lelliottia sp. 7254-16]POZ26384.1 hypothetical protein C3711_12510 [Lelliottia aquatilis]
MKLIKNESEYRDWMIKDYHHLEDESFLYSYLSPEELDDELIKNMPLKYPCIGLITYGNSTIEPAVTQFLYQDQIEEWANIMKQLDNSH